MMISKSHVRFLEENYDLIRLWIHHNDAHIAMRRQPTRPSKPSELPIDYARFAEQDALLSRFTTGE